MKPRDTVKRSRRKVLLALALALGVVYLFQLLWAGYVLVFPILSLQHDGKEYVLVRGIPAENWKPGVGLITLIPLGLDLGPTMTLQVTDPRTGERQVEVYDQWEALYYQYPFLRR